ncbi:UDP-N-acetylmuramate--L-alanine ligase [Candidatus Dependentiae bacterium]
MYKKKAHVHFVGIGGIGMSGIAMILKCQGYKISGCDVDIHQKSIKDLKALGCEIYEGNNTPQCKNKDINILVYSSAIKHNNPEIVAAQARGIPIIPRALMLAELMRTKYSVAIAGSHGKTTTTSLISHILIESGIDPTVIIGGHLKNISTNARLGSSDFLVAEADESDKSLVHLQATLAVLTNIDLEHLETYKNLEDIKSTFKIFLNNLPFYGKAFLCTDDENVRSILPMPHIKIITYGLDPQHADICAQEIKLNPDNSVFKIFRKNTPNPLGKIILKMPGKHNTQNCVAAIAVALDLGIKFDLIAKAVESFKGIERRFCYRGTYKGAEIFDDYGHHPKEIQNTLEIAKNRAKNRLLVAFQPHRYTRTHKLWDNFVDTFAQSNIDRLIITDIYPASEAPIEHVTSERLVHEIREKNPNFPVMYAPYDDDLSYITQNIEKNAQKDDLILSLGAGKITDLAKKLGAI